MNITDDILTYNLQNVYFLVGSACGGKTTMASAIAKKYGYIHFNDNYHEESFKNWQKIYDERNKCANPKEYDWEHHFNRSPKEYNESLGKSYSEYFEYALIEIIKLSQSNVVIADVNLCGVSCDLIKNLAEHNRIACLLAPPELVIKDYFERSDHRDIYDAIMRLKDPERALENMKDVFRYGAENIINEVKASGLFYIMRDEFSSIENTLNALEKHFGLM